MAVDDPFQMFRQGLTTCTLARSLGTHSRLALLFKSVRELCLILSHHLLEEIGLYLAVGFATRTELHALQVGQLLHQKLDLLILLMQLLILESQLLITLFQSSNNPCPDIGIKVKLVDFRRRFHGDYFTMKSPLKAA